jgi:membrane associated rhomboid family serine protease
MSQWANRGKVTKALIGINVLVFLANFASNNAVANILALSSATAFAEPWTLLTSGFAHAQWLHILLNMYSLWIFGEAIENFLGAKRYVWLYLLSIVGGSIVFVITDPAGIAIGASGGIFGLMGAYFVIIRSLGYRSSQMLGLIAINVVLSFVNPDIAIGAHIGGLITGAAIAWYFTKVRR